MRLAQSKQFIYYYSGPIVALPRKSFLTCKFDVYFSVTLFFFFCSFSCFHTRLSASLLTSRFVFAASRIAAFDCVKFAFWDFFYIVFHCCPFQFISMFWVRTQWECVAHIVFDEQILTPAIRSYGLEKCWAVKESVNNIQCCALRFTVQECCTAFDAMAVFAKATKIHYSDWCRSHDHDLWHISFGHVRTSLLAWSSLGCDVLPSIIARHYSTSSIHRRANLSLNSYCDTIRSWMSSHTVPVFPNEKHFFVLLIGDCRLPQAILMRPNLQFNSLIG